MGKHIGVPFKPLPVGILGDVSRGVLSPRDFSVYCWLLANSHWEDCGLRTSAVHLGQALSHSAQAIQRALRRLERAGWIRRSRNPGQRGGYLIRVLIDPCDLHSPLEGATPAAETGGEVRGDTHGETQDETLDPDVKPGARDSHRAPRDEAGGEEVADGPSCIEIEKEKEGGGALRSSFSSAVHRCRNGERADSPGKGRPEAPASPTSMTPPDDDTGNGENTLRGVLRRWRELFPLAGNISDEMAEKVFEEAHALGIAWARLRTLMEQHLRLSGDRGAAPWRILREELNQARRKPSRPVECHQCREGIIEATVTDADGELNMMRLRCSCRTAEIRATQGARPLASLPRFDDLIPPQQRNEAGIFAHNGILKRCRSPAKPRDPGQAGTTPTIMLGTSRLTWLDDGG